MEHLLLPHGASVGEDECAPFIAIDWDDGPFLTYPERSIFVHLHEELNPKGDYHVLEKINFTVAQTRSLETFIQTWLVFGLLHEIFGRQGRASEFVVPRLDSAGRYAGRFLSTTALLGIATNWAESWAHLTDTDEANRLLDHLNECISVAFGVLNAAGLPAHLTPWLLWSTVSVTQTLQWVVDKALQYNGTKSVRTWSDWDSHIEVFIARMHSNGWCPADVKKWRLIAGLQGGFQLLYYLSRMKQPQVKNHNRCIADVCMATQYDMYGQATVHRCAAEYCGTMGVDDEAMIATFDDGHFGLLEFQDAEDIASLRAVVVSTKDVRDYIAISHVWADGMDNPHANQLPRCQLLHIAEAARQLSRQAGHANLPVWLDTMCCPINSPSHRSTCLMLMRQIYQGATIVLLVDTQIERYNLSGLDSVEINARALFSSWMTRLWTLQEGALTK
ncbi:hypothetical protein LTR62_003384 [Meristemomyces frigidus]|uniref:Heterokaryon incompatibility domain-containing protein n=1 Tax=Meristemomyces frigidus TaxID=1508187 RepID=A0AAN7TIV7_9PEZI|nr:hypothetical protein LTR62_003384 [Meristemomyces frigidus]